MREKVPRRSIRGRVAFSGFPAALRGRRLIPSPTPAAAPKPLASTGPAPRDTAPARGHPRFYAAIEAGLRRIEAVTSEALAGAVALARLSRTRSAKAPIAPRELAGDGETGVARGGDGDCAAMAPSRPGVGPSGAGQGFGSTSFDAGIPPHAPGS